MSDHPPQLFSGLDDLFPPDEPFDEAPAEVTSPDPQPQVRVESAAAVQPEAEQMGLLPEVAPVSVVPERVEPPEPEPQSEPLVLPMGEVLAIVNQKGGVGKTTTTINLGAALAEMGARVLLVDLDPQGALSVGLGLRVDEGERTVHNVLLEEAATVEAVRRPTRVEGLDVLPSNIDLSVAELQLSGEVAREQILKRKLAPVLGEYNYVLIDCPPSLGLLTVNALTAATGVLIPLECEYFALRGLVLLDDSIRKIQHLLNPGLEITGILPTMLDSRTVHSREVLARVADAYGDKLFKTSIRKTIRFAEAPVVGEPILSYAPSSIGAQEYRDLAMEVVSR